MQIIIEDSARKVFRFRANYNHDAALQQAEKKKLDAFGALSKLKFWDRPKEEDVVVSNYQLQYEPFWYCFAERKCTYKKKAIYSVKAKSTYATDVALNGQLFGVNHGSISIEGIEHCTQDNQFDEYFPGLSRASKNLGEYKKKFASLIELLEPEGINSLEYLEPEQRASLIIHTAIKNITVPIDADEILKDEIHILNLHIYYRPVYNFEFTFAQKGLAGIIQIDGLNGEIVARGDTQLNKAVGKLLTRESLFDLGTEIAGVIMPGGNVIVKAVDTLTK
ncbi:MAG: hypothetical protein LWW76_03425 [Burkholderiales bacterium]|nr:hypothetical protein [Burkholderiales bacterium]